MVNSATYNRIMWKLMKGVDHAGSFVDDLTAHTKGWHGLPISHVSRKLLRASVRQVSQLNLLRFSLVS